MVRAMSNDKNVTDGLENKDLAAVVAKPAKAESKAKEASGTVKVVLVHHYTYDGKNHLPGATVDLPAELAGSLIAQSFATRA